jgi:hypothetical protein
MTNAGCSPIPNGARFVHVVAVSSERSRSVKKRFHVGVNQPIRHHFPVFRKHGEKQRKGGDVD